MLSCQNFEEVWKEMKRECEVPDLGAASWVPETESRSVRLGRREREGDRTELGDHRGL